MTINSLQLSSKNLYTFKGEPKVNSDSGAKGKPVLKAPLEKDEFNNPISSAMENFNTTKATVWGGIVFAAWTAFEFLDWGDVFTSKTDKVDDLFGDLSKEAAKEKLPEKGFKAFCNKNPWAKPVLALGGFIAVVAGLYTATHLPKNLYKTKVETFKKKKEVEVYAKTNSAEKHILERMDDEAKVANSAEKQKLASNYLKVKAAKNDIPYFLAPNKVKPELL